MDLYHAMDIAKKHTDALKDDLAGLSYAQVNSLLQTLGSDIVTTHEHLLAWKLTELKLEMEEEDNAS